jgi:hypothetical protein
MMAHLDLDDLFPHLGKVEVHASDVFTDRELESEALESSLRSQRAALDAGTIGGTERRNVLTYFGTGGIGKTALSKRLQLWLQGALPDPHGWGPTPDIPIAATARVDLHLSGGNVDILQALVDIRTSFGAVKRSWPAFDLAFAAYWSAARPSQELPKSSKDDSSFGIAALELLGDVASHFELLEAMDVVAGVAGKLITVAVKQGRRSSQRRQAQRSFGGYEALLRKAATLPSSAEPHYDFAASLAALLSVELNDDPTAIPLTVVFIDTFERIQDSGSEAEALVNQLVYSMPYTLFVITGRNQVTWHHADKTHLPRRGPLTWPGLVVPSTVNPRQHLVEHLSPPDRRRLITLVRDREQLPVSDEVVEQLVIASGGLPLYLDLAADKARWIKANGGGAVTIDHVTGSLEKLVVSVLNDVPKDEQRALRAACLLPYFDTRLIAAGAGVEHGAAERAAHRGLVASNDHPIYGYRVHDEVRQAIRTAPHTIAGGWSEKDWAVAATRMIDEVRHRYSAASRDDDARLSLENAALAISLLCATTEATEPDWLAKAMVHGPSVGALAPLLPTATSNAIGQAYLDFVTAKSPSIRPEESVSLLRSIADGSTALANIARRHLAYKLREASRYDEAIAEFEILIAKQPGVQVNVAQRATTLATARRFSEALDAAQGLEPLRERRLLAEIDFAHGHTDGYVATRTEYIEWLRSGNRQKEWIESVGGLARYRVLIDEAETTETANEHLAHAREVGHTTAAKDALGSLALLAVGNAPLVDQYCEELERLEALNSFDPLTGRLVLPRLLQAHLDADLDRLERLRARVESKDGTRGREWIPHEFLFADAGVALRTRVATDWLEPVESVRDRWRALFDAFYRRRGIEHPPANR